MKKNDLFNNKQKENSNMKQRKITKRTDDYSKWYLDVIREASLLDDSPVKGCMVMRPYGYALWEKIQKILDLKFKETGVENAYFPLLIPKSFFEKEASHVDGFAKECAIVTHHRLESDGKGKLMPAGELEEPLVIRPTSETIMYSVFACWIQSYRDLPLLINQWANIVRWEMKTRPFLRTTEFLWQEGHTAHASEKEAEQKTLQMIDIYREFAEEYLAIPVVPGRKTESEKFAGADYTTTIEAMMQDGKALQAGTSHMLGQNFAKAFDVCFLDQSGKQSYAWQTSWGLSTRIIGAIIMTHSDDNGLILPPNIAPIQVVIIPVWSSEEEKQSVFVKAEEIFRELGGQYGLLVKIDVRDGRPGPKFFEWEKKGVPVRIEIGPRDISSGTIVVVRRDMGTKESVLMINCSLYVKELLEKIQKNLFNKALEFRKSHTFNVDTWNEFKQLIDKGGFLMAHWCGSVDCETKIKEETRATTRCIPFSQEEESGQCIYCGEKSNKRIIFAKAY
jgi:prolyl-tRNA synthetase